MLKQACLVTGAFLAVQAPAQAQEIAAFGVPTVEYEGTRTLTTGDVSIEQDIYSAAGRTRAEMELEGRDVVQIWRDDLQKIWLLAPSDQLAMELDFGRAAQDSTFAKFDEGTVISERRSEGQEKVNGVTANKEYFEASFSTGESASGWVWRTPQNITVRMRLSVVEPDGETQTMNYDLTDLEIDPQPSWLFDVPSNYELVAVDTNSTLPGVGNYMEQLAEQAGRAAQHEAERRLRMEAREAASDILGGIF